MRTFKIYSHSNFENMQYRVVTMLCPSPPLSSKQNISRTRHAHKLLVLFSFFHSRAVILNLEVYKMYRNLYLDCEYCSWKRLKGLNCILRSTSDNIDSRRIFVFHDCETLRLPLPPHKIRFSGNCIYQHGPLMLSVALISHCISLGIGTLTLNFIIFYLLTFNFILEVKFP